MSVEQKLDELITQSKAERQQADRDRHANFMYVFWGFALATLSLAVTHISTASTAISALATFGFFVLGWVELFRAYLQKTK
jgi:Flp pilus assembly protein TadB